MQAIRPAVTTDNKNITEQIAFIHHAITEQSHTVHNTARLITAAIVEAIRTFVFVFISFIFCLFQKKSGTGWLYEYYILAFATARRRAAFVFKFGAS